MKDVSPRRTAVALLDKITGEKRLMSELGFMLDKLPAPDRARALRLCNDTLRGMDRADRLLSRQLRRKPPLHVQNVLRLGTTELCNGGDAFGVVDELAGVVGSNRRYLRYKGLVNAILRQMSGDAGKPWRDLRIPQIPNWLRGPLVSAWGKGTVGRIEAAHFKGAPLDITAKSDAEAWANKLNGKLLETGSIRLQEPGQVSSLEGYAQGAWWVQDAAAAIAVKVLAPRPGEKILDLCAAPGGKTMQLAAAGADVTALDVSEKRMAGLKENLARTGLTAKCEIGDALEFQGGPYDAILLDAPCSATGTIRRHPDLPHAKDGSEFNELIALQAEMLDHALTLLAPKGRLVFCTCSLLPDEGEAQIDEALLRHPGLTTDTASLKKPGIEPDWVTQEGGLRLRPDYWPDCGGMDGFYIACLRY